MGKKLIVSDLDGTLLDQFDGLSPIYIDQLNAMIRKGLAFTLATGRDMKKAKKAVPGLILNYPVILTNGALMGDLNTETFTKITWIPTPIVKVIMQHADHLQIPPMAFGAYDPTTSQMHFQKGKWGPKGIVYLPVEKWQPYSDMQVVTIQFHDHQTKLAPLKQWIEAQFGSQINLIYIEDVGYKHATGIADWYWLEINSIDAGKEKAIVTLAEVTGFSLQDIIVFGDNHNDLGMFSKVGKAIAVENADPAVKRVAHAVCGSNHTGGVIRYLQEHWEELG